MGQIDGTGQTGGEPTTADTTVLSSPPPWFPSSDWQRIALWQRVALVAVSLYKPD